MKPRNINVPCVITRLGASVQEVVRSLTTSAREITEPAKYWFKVLRSLCNFTGDSAAVLSRHPSLSEADEISYRLVNIGQLHFKFHTKEGRTKKNHNASSWSGLTKVDPVGQFTVLWLSWIEYIVCYNWNKWVMATNHIWCLQLMQFTDDTRVTMQTYTVEEKKCVSICGI